MKRRPTLIVCATLLLLGPGAAADRIEHHVSQEFSPDQIAVYSFILKSYQTLLKPTYRDMLSKAFYLEDKTEPLDMRELRRGRGCLNGIDLESVPKEKIPTVHRLAQQRWLPSYVRSASRVKCLDSRPAKSEICWRSEGVLSLTEILFDRSHTHALVGFSVGCGMQCGWGELVILQKRDGHWHRQAVCEERYT